MTDFISAAIDVGDKAEAFIGTDIGRYVFGRIQQDIDIGMQELREASPGDTIAVMRAQERLIMLERLPMYLAEIIQERDKFLEEAEMNDDE